MREKLVTWWGTEAAKKMRALLWSVGATVVFNAVLGIYLLKGAFPAQKQ